MKCGLETVGAVLADDIVAVEVGQTDALCYDEGKAHVRDGQRNVREYSRKHVTDDGQDGTYVGISGDTPALQSTDTRRDCSRLGQVPEQEPEIWPLRASTHDVPGEANIYTHVRSVMDGQALIQ